MLSCPACGFDNADDVSECGRCHLAAGLFEPVREAVGVPESDPKYLEAVTELLALVDSETAPPAPATETGPGVLQQPARFPSAPAAVPATTVPPAPRPPDFLPPLPALPPGAGVPLLRHQVDEYLQLGRRQGVDLEHFSVRARQAVLAQDRPSLERLSRDLFVTMAAALTEQYEWVLAKRNDLNSLVPTPEADVELESCRAALAIGDLAGTQRRLRAVDEALTDLEDHWATVQILTTEADLLAETIRELGGNPGPALGPLEEGRRLVRDGQRDVAEPVLARATLALWTVLNPLFSRELKRLKEAILARRDEGSDSRAALVPLRDLAGHLTRRNFGAAVASYRRLRQSVDAPLADRPTVVPPASTGPASPA